MLLYTHIYIYIFARVTYTPLGGGRVAPGSVRGVRSDKGPWPATHATLNAAINLILNGPAAAADSITPPPRTVLFFPVPFRFLILFFSHSTGSVIRSICYTVATAVGPRYNGACRRAAALARAP